MNGKITCSIDYKPRMIGKIFRSVDPKPRKIGNIECMGNPSRRLVDENAGSYIVGYLLLNNLFGNCLSFV